MANNTEVSARAPARLKILNPKRNLALAYSLLFAALLTVYLCFTFIPGPQTAVLREFNLTTSEYYSLVIPLEAVLAVIWIIGFYGALKIRLYAWLIEESKEGRALSVLSDGLLVLILAQPFVSALGGIFEEIERSHAYTIKPLTIVENYIALALTGAAFILISWGARRLYLSAPRRRRPLPQTFWVLAAAIASGLYSYFVLIQPIHSVQARRVYFLSDWLLVLTIAVPYLCFWYFGVYGAYYIFLYQKGLVGRLYKRALVFVSSGVAVVVVSSVATRVVVSLSSHLTNLKITPVLMIIYALLVLEALGFILIAVGASKLQQIEEV